MSLFSILGRIETLIEIKAPPEKVWEILAFDRFPEWDYGEDPQSVEYTSEVHSPEDKYRVGATAQGIPKNVRANLTVCALLVFV